MSIYSAELVNFMLFGIYTGLCIVLGFALGRKTRIVTVENTGDKITVATEQRNFRQADIPVKYDHVSDPFNDALKHMDTIPSERRIPTI